MNPGANQPRFIAHYRVARLLGSGGMGEVLLAEDTRLDRPVALKLLPKEVAEDASRRKRFLAEAKAASALNHSNICTIYEAGETSEGQPYIAMEYLEGQTLEALARRRRLQLREIVGIGLQVAEALEAARQSQVVHRDIKPGNIVVLNPKSEIRNPHLQVKVLDFGLAKRLDQAGDAPTLTQEGAVVGTPNYLSPELALGREVDSCSDIFSLGVVLYELAAGRNPFAGASFGDTVNNVLNRNPDPLKPWNPTVTAEFERIVFKCLEKDAAKRYATPAQLRDDLAKLQTHLQTPQASSQKLWAVAAIVVAVGVTALGLTWLMRSKPATHPAAPAKTLTPVQQNSLAVLPFLNLSADKADEYLSDGISEDLSTALTPVRGLNVRSWQSCRAFKGKTDDIRKIGEQLSVAMVLAGSVTKAGNKLRINAQLSDVVNGTQLWATTHDREMADILEIRSDIARQLASALKAHLGLEETQRLVKQPTVNAGAYRLYLQGRYQWNRRINEAIQRAIGFFNQAVAEDPAYALAHAGLADCYILLPDYANRPPRDAFPKAKAAALEALKWDSTLAEPHAALAYVKAYYDWDWSGAVAEFRRAIALNPNYATAHHWLSVVLETMGRYDEALAEIKLAQALDPLSPIINARNASFLFFAGTPDLAVEALKKQIALDPSFVGAHNSLGLVYAYQAKWPETIAEFETIRRLDPNGTFGLDLLGLAYARAGRADEAQKVLDQLLEFQRQGLDLRIYIATVLHGLGDDEGALKSLEDGLAEHALGLDYVNSEPYLKDLRRQPRAQAVLRKMNLISEPAANLTTPDLKSVAVLPFVNVSGDKADEPLSDGITDELISTLQPVNALQVKGRASSFFFKGKNERLQKIGQDLQVKYLVEGTVSRAGNTLRITVDLVTAADETQLWAMKYDRPLDDLLAIRTDVATRVAESLKGKLLGEERQQLAKQGTENAEAYRLYLQGRYQWNRRTSESLTQAIEDFNQAVTKDPSYAPAYAGLAECYDVLPFYTALPLREAAPKARAAALKALELDSNLAEPHTTLADVKGYFDWHWSEAEAEFRRAIALKPNYATAHHWLCELLSCLGRYEEALDQIKLAQESDPLSPIINATFAEKLSLSGKQEAAIKALKRQISIDPSFAQAHSYLGLVYLRGDKWTEAVIEFETVRRLDPNGANGLDSLGFAYARAGRTNQAQGVLSQLQALQERGFDLRVGIALVQHALGDDARALDTLETAFNEHAVSLEYLKHEPIWKNLRTHPRVQAILKKMNLVK